MKTLLLLAVLAAITTSGCVQTPPGHHAPPHAARMQDSGARYTACVSSEADKAMTGPMAAEDIAVAAHARCWAAWDGYRKATSRSFSHGATTREEIQLAHDKADAHLRQFELETRRTIVDSIIHRSLPGAKPAR